MVRIDISEVALPLKPFAWTLIMASLAMFFGSGSFLAFLWRQQSSVAYKKHAEMSDALLKSEDKYRVLFECAGDAYFIQDEKTTFAVNPTACNRLGYSHAELMAMPPGEVEVPEQRRCFPERFVRLAECGHVIFETVHQRKDGQAIPTDVMATNISWNGRPAVMSICRDITERKQAEETLRQRERELQERNDGLMRFTYTISHDLKSPLVTISVFLNYLEQDLQQADPAAVAKDLAYIRNAAGRMSKLLDELLALSRVGHVESPAVDVPLQTVVQEALALVAGQIAARGVQVDVTAVPIFLHGDRSRFVEVFQNLLDNACKFMGAQPSPRIEIAVEETAGEQVIVVRDNGNGIDPRFLSKIFGLFEKLDPESGGTGIGLALVRRIVEVHGGRIWVESEGLGQGATFRFTLAKTHLRP